MSICLAAMTVGTSGSSAPGTSPSTQYEVSDAIRAIVAAHNRDAGLYTSVDQKQLDSLYAPERYRPLWTDHAARPSRDARTALALLGDASREGLDPDDYGVEMIDRLATTLEAGVAGPPDVAAFDTSLSVKTLQYLRELHGGRVDPRTIGFRITVPAVDHDFTSLLRAAIAGHRIAETATELTPPLALYRGLRGMLLKYRSLAADTTLGHVSLPGAPVRPGNRCPGLRALHHHLVALGDLAADAPAPAAYSAYDGALVEGVKRFQVRHGLRADGVIGKDTRAALDVPLEWRVRQIELALERLRWLPQLGAERLLAVNIPMFQLWGWDSTPGSAVPSFGMGVIVGRALDMQTPVFTAEMPYLVFRPYWNVPPSILRHEILPALQRHPDYLRRQDMEIVRGEGDDARVVPVNEETIARLRQGTLRLRQRPGPKNSLGLVKFVFPNDANVYMHGTPAPRLFTRARRDFSHGCVRVEDPVALAEWALKEQPGWDRDRILAAMSSTEPRRVNLTRPIQVILFYSTAVVMPEDGSIRFADDIYGHDARLDRALARRIRR